MTRITELLVNLPLPASILIRVTVVLAVGWLLHFLLQKRNPHWRLLAWRCAVISLLLIPILVPFSYLQISVPHPADQTEISSYQPLPALVPYDSPSPSASPPPRLLETPAIEISPPSLSWSHRLLAKIPPTLLLLWVIVAAILTMRLFTGFIQVRKKLLSSSPAPEHLQRSLKNIARDLDLPGSINLRIADVSTPFIAGLLHPTIVIPHRMTDSDRQDQAAAIFAHEIAHHISRDHIWTLLIRWLEVIFWFHPLLWQFRNAHSLACEEVCDAVAADYLGSPESYANTLAALALEVVGKINVPGAIPMARSSEIIERLRTLRQQLYPHTLGRRWLLLSAFLTAIILTVLGGIGLVYAEPAGRVLHFPKDRSLGKITVMDVNQKREIKSFLHWGDSGWNVDDEYLGQAQGDVVIPAGKKVALTVNRNAVNDLSPLLDLKPDDLYMLSLAYLPARDRCMKYVAHLTGLKELNLIETSITDAGLKLIPKLKSLDCLTLPNSVTNSGLYNIAGMASLKRLYLLKSKVTDKGLYQISKMKSLEELSLAGENISGTGLVHLTKLPSLHYLLLNGQSFGGTGTEHLRNIPSLKILTFRDTSISDAGVRQLSGHPGLENLGFIRAGITDRGLAYLKTMPSLKKLCIYQSSGVTDNGMVHLGRINSLEYLDLPGISDKGVASIAKLTNLKKLNIYGDSNTKITDVTLQRLSGLQSLEGLMISGISCTDDGMDYLAKLTNLKKLNISADAVTNEGLAKLKTLKSLEQLYFTSRNVTVSGLSHLNAFKNLFYLNVNGIWQDDSGMDISGLTALEQLTLKFKTPLKRGDSYDPVRDEDLACLKNLKNLKWFQVAYPQHSRITDAGVSHLKDLTNIERLGIGSPYLTDTSLSCLTNMKKLNHLNVTGNFTDSGLRDLEGLKALQFVRIISSESLSPISQQQLRDSLPIIYTFNVKQNTKLK